MAFKFELGTEVQDTITGSSGTITSRHDYVTGCNRYGLEWKSDDGKHEFAYFNEERLAATD